ncbi:MlaC/ttg2D family ABC transporter substrate-binding protein [Ottowia sp.]|uniref:MlaC/ttg2D family ABC transporter substrate-binding protein n=1 Tax=Ottowia sp. TaxID=1898956 RepID=UPI003A83F3BD
MSQLNRRTFVSTVVSSVFAMGALGMSAPGWAADEAPDALIQRLSNEVLQTARTDQQVQGGDIQHMMTLVDAKIMPYVNFTRMTAATTGPAWRRATADQRQQLQQEFKTLLVRTYAGALRRASDQTIEVRPMRGGAGDKEVLVRTLVKGRGDPVQIDYRMEKTSGQSAGWKIYDMNVMGVWLVDTYRPQFAQQINASGIDGLIKLLEERNKANAA